MKFNFLNKGMKKFLGKYIGDKEFYRQVFVLIIPIMIQQLFLSVAGYVDSLMINAYGGVGFVEAYNGVSAANKLMFILSFVWMAFASTASVFISQFYGAKNKEKVHEGVRLAVYAAALIGALSYFIVMFFGNGVVDSFVESEVAREYGYRYLEWMKWGTLISAVNMGVSTSFRSVKQTLYPLMAGVIGVFVNVALNYCLIFGNFGFPEMDSAGAAIATVVSRIVELVMLILVAIFSKKSLFKGTFKKFRVSKELIKQYVKKGIPLIFNELLWSIGTVLFALFYAWKNDDWYNTYSISQNVTDLYFIIFAGLGNGTAVIVGSHLGAGDYEGAKKSADRMKGLAVVMGVAMGVLMVFTAPLICDLFNPSAETKQTVVQIFIVVALFIGIYAYNSVCFFILRSGGDSLRAFILDQGPTYLISIPLAAIFGINAVAWGLTLPMIFTITHVADIIKIFISTKFVAMGRWVVNLAKKKETVIKELEKI